MEQAEIKKQGGTADDKTTWTGKRIRADGTVEGEAGEGSGVGKYLQAAKQEIIDQADDEILEYVDDEEDTAPPPKKARTGGFGNFDAW